MDLKSDELKEATETMEDTRSDDWLVELSLRSPQEFGRVFERHWDAMFRFFERRFGPDPSEDLASEVFRIAFERRSAYDPGESGTCLPWLYGIAANLVLKEQRRFSRRLFAIDRFAVFEPPIGRDHSSFVVDQVDAEHVWSRLRTALEEMENVTREMLLMVAWDELSYAEVALAFSVPIGTVRSRLHRARLHLKAAIDDTPVPPRSLSMREKNE